ncbi:MAG: polyprenyl synthetase family protein [Thermoplasmata archaeon]|nr:polyprenyl synthetase family protein [Thermoplasmata archaeon]
MKKSKLTLEAFFATTKRDVEKAIKNRIKDKTILSQLEGGKRLRPIIAILSFKACTGGKESKEVYRRAVEGTVGIELAHTASLVSDDIIDRDTLRRGKPSLYVEKGIEVAILISQKMLALGFDIALDRGINFVKLYIETWNDALSGELLEIEINKREFLSVPLFSTYLKIIEKKTSSIFASACKAGALEANASSKIVRILGEYGKEVGIAYQLADDLVDLCNGEGLESVILPLLNRIDKDDVNNISKRDIEKKILEHEKEIKTFFIREIKNRVKKAEKLIKTSPLPDSIYKELLSQAPKYIVNKMLQSIDMVI